MAWTHLEQARILSNHKLREIANVVEGCDSEDTSTVVMGSLARGEFTPGSDIDWYLLVDGSAQPFHHDAFRRAGKLIDPLAAKLPGREGTFGAMVFSHGLIHHIGGDDDTNLNTTRRLLLLLESRVAGRPEAWERVVKNILYRYVTEDRSLWKGAEIRVPHFLLNDLARFWRTMAVDFAYKLRNRGGRGWAIRNIKLRMSRKLIYVSGLLACYSCHLERAVIEAGASQPDDRKRLLVEHLFQRFSQSPLQIAARLLLQQLHLDGTAAKILGSYNQFIGLLADGDTRKRLEHLSEDEMETDALFQHARGLSHTFRDGLLELFFDRASGLEALTRSGIF